MSTHLITVLGTSLYKPIIYGGGAKRDEYVQCAMIRRFAGELEDDKGSVTVLLTGKAKERNWEDRRLEEKDEKTSLLWEEDLRVAAGNTHKGLDARLKEEFPNISVNPEDIPEGADPTEIMEIFNVLYNTIKEGDEVIFDITHSFRSIPMIVVSALRYAKTMKNCKLKGIYYGAFEAAKNGVAPLMDLSLYNEIIEWSFAAEQFTKYGNALPMRDVYNSSTETTKDKDLKGLVNAMTNLSETIMTSRGSNIGNKSAKQGKKVKQSIKQAYKKFSEMKVDICTNPALANLIDYAKDKYKGLDKHYDYEIGMEVVRLCIDFNLINQGYTALQETIKTFICERYELDSQNEEDREDIVAMILGAKAKFYQEKKENPGLKERDFFINENQISKDAYEKATSQIKEKMYKIFEDIPKEFVQNSSVTGDIRNDINHFGIRPQPLEPEQFKKKLKEMYDIIKQAMEKMIANKP